MVDLRLENGQIYNVGGYGLRYGDGFAGFFGFEYVFAQFAFSEREREREISNK